VGQITAEGVMQGQHRLFEQHLVATVSAFLFLAALFSNSNRLNGPSPVHDRAQCRQPHTVCQLLRQHLEHRVSQLIRQGSGAFCAACTGSDASDQLQDQIIPSGSQGVAPIT
jgi:hypothetical protein